MAAILIIDDDAAVVGALKALLEANGHVVSTASDGKSGLEAAESRSFDVILVDLFMPGMNGLDTTKALREKSPSTPIIAMSGFMFPNGSPQMPGFDSIATESGATATLYKPVRPKLLLETINNATRTLV